MDFTLGGILLLGLVIGLQHALEADHVAAVSSIASGETSLRKIVVHGALWVRSLMTKLPDGSNLLLV